MFLADVSWAFQGRWVTVFRAQWSPNPDVLPHFTVRRQSTACCLILTRLLPMLQVGNLDHSLEIYSCKVGSSLTCHTDRVLH